MFCEFLLEPFEAYTWTSPQTRAFPLVSNDFAACRSFSFSFVSRAHFQGKKFSTDTQDNLVIQSQLYSAKLCDVFTLFLFVLIQNQSFLPFCQVTLPPPPFSPSHRPNRDLPSHLQPKLWPPCYVIHLIHFPSPICHSTTQMISQGTAEFAHTARHTLPPCSGSPIFWPEPAGPNAPVATLVNSQKQWPLLAMLVDFCGLHISPPQVISHD